MPFDSMLPGTAVAQRAAHMLEEWLESRLHPPQLTSARPEAALPCFGGHLGAFG